MFFVLTKIGGFLLLPSNFLVILLLIGLLLLAVTRLSDAAERIVAIAKRSIGGPCRARASE